MVILYLLLLLAFLPLEGEIALLHLCPLLQYLRFSKNKYQKDLQKTKVIKSWKKFKVVTIHLISFKNKKPFLFSPSGWGWKLQRIQAISRRFVLLSSSSSSVSCAQSLKLTVWRETGSPSTFRTPNLLLRADRLSRKMSDGVSFCCFSYFLIQKLWNLKKAKHNLNKVKNIYFTLIFYHLLAK